MSKHIIGALVFTAIGCASIRIPEESLQRSEASIKSAEEVGANDVPKAKLHVQYARDQTADAKKLAAEGDDRALLLVGRAQADADLALSLAHEARMHAAATRAGDELKALQSQGTP